MQRDSELKEMAVSSRQRLVQEFSENFTDLQVRADRMDVDQARQFATELSCPLQIAIVAEVLDMEGILGRKEAVRKISRELQRRSSVGEDIPNLPGNIMEFALKEGQWVEYIEGRFVGDLERKTRDLANLEEALDQEKMAVESAISVLRSRRELAEAYILPILETWVREHPKATTGDAIVAFCQPLTKWGPSTLRGKLNRKRRRNQAFFRLLAERLSHAEDSATIDFSIKRVNDLVAALDADLENMELRALSHLILHIAPRPTGRGDKSPYVQFTGQSSRGNKTEPDMESPFDFLERDIYLATRRREREQDAFLLEKIARVIRVLRYRDQELEKIVQQSLHELAERFGIDDVNFEDIADDFEAKLSASPMEKREATAAEFILDFIKDYHYSR
ncbi:hypothetical protein EU546_01755 [Candidatus Thorarchaeota archaeon]|nr:MAG: hypothetical protein EU546_01755 [Candidatus Thorarchaeota archaeon]